jgi:hypothetical protein
MASRGRARDGFQAHKIQDGPAVDSGRRCGGHHLCADDGGFGRHRLVLGGVKEERLIGLRIPTEPIAKCTIAHSEDFQRCDCNPFINKSTAAIAHSRAA